MLAAIELPDEKEVTEDVEVKNEFTSKRIELYDLQGELGSITEWYTLGIALRVPHKSLETLYHDYRSTEERFLHMLVLWKNLEEPTWEKLVEALKKARLPQLAAKIASKHGVFGHKIISINTTLTMCKFAGIPLEISRSKDADVSKSSDSKVDDVSDI